MINTVRELVAVWLCRLALAVHEDTVFDIVDRANASPTVDEGTGE